MFVCRSCLKNVEQIYSFALICRLKNTKIMERSSIPQIDYNQILQRNLGCLTMPIAWASIYNILWYKMLRSNKLVIWVDVRNAMCTIQMHVRSVKTSVFSHRTRCFFFPGGLRQFKYIYFAH